MEYGIANVEHDGKIKNDVHIAEVTVYTKSFLDEDWNSPENMRIRDIIENIENGEEYVELKPLGNNKFESGSKIILKKFITTIGDNDKHNNLRSLPGVSTGIWE